MKESELIITILIIICALQFIRYEMLAHKYYKLEDKLKKANDNIHKSIEYKEDIK